MVPFPLPWFEVNAGCRRQQDTLPSGLCPPASFVIFVTHVALERDYYLFFSSEKKNPRFDFSLLKDANAFLPFSCLSSCQEGTLGFYLLCVKGKQPPTNAGWQNTETLGNSLGSSLWVGGSLWTAHEQPS